MQSVLNPEPVVDKKEPFSADDISFLKTRMARQIRVWTVLAAVGGTLILFWQPWSLYYLTILAGTWAAVSVCIWLIFRHTIENGVKLVTRGVIAARFKRSEENSRNKSLDDDCVLQINGKLIRVSGTCYAKYHKRDVVEFHYLDSGLILHDKLISKNNP
jgi:hypothetical protein